MDFLPKVDLAAACLVHLRLPCFFCFKMSRLCRKNLQCTGADVDNGAAHGPTRAGHTGSLGTVTYTADHRTCLARPAKLALEPCVLDRLLIRRLWPCYKRTSLLDQHADPPNTTVDHPCSRPAVMVVPLRVFASQPNTAADSENSSANLCR